MGISGFVLDLLVPGLLVIAAGLVVAVEFDVDVEQNPSGVVATVVVTGVLVVAYLAGIAMRHSFDHLLPPHSQIYHDHLKSKWAEEVPVLIERWLVDEPRGTEVSDSSVSVDHAGEMVRRIRAFYMSTSEEAWAAQVQYNRDIARVASNSIVPLSLLIVTAAIGSAKRGFSGDYAPAAIYITGVFLLGAIVLGLRRAHRRRLCWTVDIVVRTDVAHRIRGTDR